MKDFYLSKRSLNNLEGVHKDLQDVVKRAIQITSIDFGITQGIRTKEEQYQLIKSGASRTMNSRHLTGHAVDVVAYLGSRISWDWPLYEKIAEAFQQASRELCVPVVWGGCWKNLQYVNDLDEAIQEYINRKRRQGKKPLLDGPHFELLWTSYPLEK